jgi:cytochrome d ubiquinol oxidase subunit I
VKGGIGIPGLNSLLVGFSTDTVVTGLEDIPADERPPANTLLHLSFDAMVGIGSALLLLAGWLALVWWRRRDIPRTPWFLRAVAVSGVASIVALWAGWIVTEVGRQPWIVQGYMRTSEAVTEAEGIWFAFAVVVALYAALGTGAILVLRSMSRRWRVEGEEPGSEGTDVPYGPSRDSVEQTR